jgi:hypothetical protein
LKRFVASKYWWIMGGENIFRGGRARGFWFLDQNMYLKVLSHQIFLFFSWCQ